MKRLGPTDLEKLNEAIALFNSLHPPEEIVKPLRINDLRKRVENFHLAHVLDQENRVSHWRNSMILYLKN